MCAMCSGFVDWCGEGTCARYGNDERLKKKHFYLMDDFCEHLTEKWGTKSASMYYHVEYDHGWDFTDGSQYSCEDDCLENEWWTFEALDKVIKSIRKAYGEDNA